MIWEPGNPSVFYAGTWRMLRTPYSMESGGEGSGQGKKWTGCVNYLIRLDDKISGLYDFAVSGNTAPAKQVKEAFAELGGQADVQLNKLKRIIEVDVVRFNEMIREKALPVIGVKKE